MNPLGDQYPEAAREAPRRSWPRALLALLALRSGVALPARTGAVLLVLLALASIATWIGIDRLRLDGELEFYPDHAVPAMACHALAVLGVAAILARSVRPAGDFAQALAVLLAATPLAIAVTLAIETWVAPSWRALAGAAVAAYLLFYAGRAAHSLSGRRQPRAILVAMLAVLGLRWVDQVLYLEPSVWAEVVSEEEAEINERAWHEAERILFDQSQRIDAAVATLAPSDAARPSVYFLGFAGMGEQRVFAEEIGLAARVIGERYAATQRTVLLLNDRRDLEAAPLASPTALRYALRALGERMAPDKDILFLALSSHGSEQTIAVSNGIFMLQDLSADQLARALQDSCIQWRVIVISACHSGSFIDALRNPRTIVLTAAATDRTSFGCSDERELTYFGEAFYRDALPLAGSLREAFAQTRAAIDQRERSEQIDASDPQAWFGAELEARLAPLESARAATRGQAN